jgi:hypothetical protein
VHRCLLCTAEEGDPGHAGHSPQNLATTAVQNSCDRPSCFACHLLTMKPNQSCGPHPTAWCRYGLSGLRSACLKVVVATLDLDNVCHNMLLAHDHKCSELSQVSSRTA